MTTDIRNRMTAAALARGYAYPDVVNGSLIVWHRPTGTWVNWIRDILAPQGLIPHDYQVTGEQDALRLLDMIPPAR